MQESSERERVEVREVKERLILSGKEGRFRLEGMGVMVEKMKKKCVDWGRKALVKEMEGRGSGDGGNEGKRG